MKGPFTDAENLANVLESLLEAHALPDILDTLAGLCADRGLMHICQQLEMVDTTEIEGNF